MSLAGERAVTTGCPCVLGDWDLSKVPTLSGTGTYAEVLDAGQVLASAKDLNQMQTVITISTVDGILAAFFALLVLVVLADAARIWVKAVRRGSLAMVEAPSFPSRLAVAGGQPARLDDRYLAGLSPQAPAPGKPVVRVILARVET